MYLLFFKIAKEKYPFDIDEIILTYLTSWTRSEVGATACGRRCWVLTYSSILTGTMPTSRHGISNIYNLHNILIYIRITFKIFPKTTLCQFILILTYISDIKARPIPGDIYISWILEGWYQRTTLYHPHCIQSCYWLSHKFLVALLE